MVIYVKIILKIMGILFTLKVTGALIQEGINALFNEVLIVETGQVS